MALQEGKAKLAHRVLQHSKKALIEAARCQHHDLRIPSNQNCEARKVSILCLFPLIFYYSNGKQSEKELCFSGVMKLIKDMHSNNQAMASQVILHLFKAVLPSERSLLCP